MYPTALSILVGLDQKTFPESNVHPTLTLRPYLAILVWCLLPGLACRQALERTAGPDTLILLGVTRTDTGPAFFDALDKVREGR